MRLMRMEKKLFVNVIVIEIEMRVEVGMKWHLKKKKKKIRMMMMMIKRMMMMM